MLQWKLLTNGKTDTIVEEVQTKTNTVADDANHSYNSRVNK